MSEKAIFASIYCTIEKAIFLEQWTKISILSPDLQVALDQRQIPHDISIYIYIYIYIYKLYLAIGKSSANMLENSRTLSCANFCYTNMSKKLFISSIDCTLEKALFWTTT